MSNWRVYLTRNREYHLCGSKCVAVRHVRSGQWLLDHEAVGQKASGMLMATPQGWRSHALSTRVGSRIYFPEVEVMTSAVRGTRAPSSEELLHYLRHSPGTAREATRTSPGEVAVGVAVGDESRVDIPTIPMSSPASRQPQAQQVLSGVLQGMLRDFEQARGCAAGEPTSPRLRHFEATLRSIVADLEQGLPAEPQSLLRLAELAPPLCGEELRQVLPGEVRQAAAQRVVPPKDVTVRLSAVQDERRQSWFVRAGRVLASMMEWLWGPKPQPVLASSEDTPVILVKAKRNHPATASVARAGVEPAGVDPAVGLQPLSTSPKPVASSPPTAGAMPQASVSPASVPPASAAPAFVPPVTAAAVHPPASASWPPGAPAVQVHSAPAAMPQGVPLVASWPPGAPTAMPGISSPTQGLALEEPERETLLDLEGPLCGASGAVPPPTGVPVPPEHAVLRGDSSLPPAPARRRSSLPPFADAPKVPGLQVPPLPSEISTVSATFPQEGLGRHAPELQTGVRPTERAEKGGGSKGRVQSETGLPVPIGQSGFFATEKTAPFMLITKRPEDFVAPVVAAAVPKPIVPVKENERGVGVPAGGAPRAGAPRASVPAAGAPAARPAPKRSVPPAIPAVAKAIKPRRPASVPPPVPPVRVPARRMDLPPVPRTASEGREGMDVPPVPRPRRSRRVAYSSTDTPAPRSVRRSLRGRRSRWSS